MCLANLVKNLSSVQGKKWLSNIMTQSLDERQGDTQLDWVCCSCVFGKLKLHPSFPVFSPWSLFFSYGLQNCFIASSLSTLFFKPLHVDFSWWYLDIYQSPYLIPFSTLLLLSALTKCCGASVVGCFPVSYITIPSDSLNHCWARLARAVCVVLLLYH